MFTIGESRAISHANDTEQQAQVPGNPRRQRFSTYRNSSGERRLKLIARGEDEILKLNCFLSPHKGNQTRGTDQNVTAGYGLHRAKVLP